MKFEKREAIWKNNLNPDCHTPFKKMLSGNQLEILTLSNIIQIVVNCQRLTIMKLIIRITMKDKNLFRLVISASSKRVITGYSFYIVS